MSKKIIEKYFSDKDLKEIADNIDSVERETAGEIRFCVQIKKGFFDRKKSPREIAIKQFLKLGMHKTKHRTGLLIYILLDDRKFEILADEGINNIIQIGSWSTIEDTMSQQFKEGNYLKGVLHCISLIGEKLKVHFPNESDGTNELSNDVVIK